ncbi:MAG: HD-GYP domain-containing protein [Chloroflexia bacterium]
MKSLPPAVRAYIAAVVVLALLLLAWQWNREPLRLDVPARYFPWLCGVLLVAVASARPIPLPRSAHVSLGTVFGLSAMCLFDPTFGCTLFLTGLLLAYLYSQYRYRLWKWYQIVFNVAAQTVALDIGAEVYLFLHRGDVNPVSSWLNAFTFLVGGAVFVALNAVLVAGVIGLSERIRPWEVMLLNYHGSLIQFVSHVPLSGIVVILYKDRPWAVLLVLLPLVAIYLSYANAARLTEASRNTLQLLANLVDARDPYTAKHSRRVAQYALIIARQMQLPLPQQETLWVAATIHDLGKLAIPEALLQKAGQLDAREWEQMRLHPATGANLVGGLPILQEAQEIMACHHEHYDGTGYPDGKSGEEIPLPARILAVADALDAITSERPYRGPRSLAEALEEIRTCAGTQFDPRVVDAVLAARPLLEEVFLSERRENHDSTRLPEPVLGVPVQSRRKGR